MSDIPGSFTRKIATRDWTPENVGEAVKAGIVKVLNDIGEQKAGDLMFLMIAPRDNIEQGGIVGVAERLPRAGRA